MEKITDDLFYVGVRGVQEIGVLRAAILELQCSRCKAQERWRGRSDNAVSKMARWLGWVFDKRDALCPQHSDKPVHKPRNPPGQYIRPTVCTTAGCNDPVQPTPPDHWGRPIVKCPKHYAGNKARKEKYLAKKAARIVSLLPT